MSTMVEDPSSKIPAQTQMHHPGVEAEIEGPKPQYYSDKYVPAGMINYQPMPFCIVCTCLSPYSTQPGLCI